MKSSRDDKESGKRRDLKDLVPSERFEKLCSKRKIKRSLLFHLLIY